MSRHLLPNNLTKKELYKFVAQNENLIINAKKSQLKKADGITAGLLYINDKGEITTKADMQQSELDPTRLKVSAVINTTNWFDSYADVHIPGLWKKSLTDNKKSGFYLLNMHRYDFEDVIAESCAGMTKNLSWKELGLDYSGVTEALIFNGIINQDRNEYMFGQYQKKYVKQHSVGMRYVKMLTCIDDEDYPVQKENWDKYIDEVANKDDAEEYGIFWAVLEAQIIEGSAVLFGANSITPTLETSLMGTKNEPPAGTQDEPPFDLMKAIKETTFI